MNHKEFKEREQGEMMQGMDRSSRIDGNRGDLRGKDNEGEGQEKTAVEKTLEKDDAGKKLVLRRIFKNLKKSGYHRARISGKVLCRTSREEISETHQKLPQESVKFWTTIYVDLRIGIYMKHEITTNQTRQVLIPN